MRPPTILGTFLLAAALVAGPATAAPAAKTPAATPAPQPGPSRTVTLITGDRFLVSDNAVTATRLPSHGRENAQFLTQRLRGHLQILPTDAIPLVNEGRLDPRLFDVTTLLEYGYDDRRPTLPLIVTYTGGDAGAGKLRASAASADADVTHDLSAVNGLAVAQDKARAAEFWNALTTPASGLRARGLRGEISRVWLDGKRELLLDASVPQVKAPLAWAAGYTGTGVSVGVVDTGVDDTHPDLAGRVVSRDFTGTGDLRDTVGHGTHVASTIAGAGGRYQGVAPGAKIYSGKACVGTTCADSAIVAAMQWMAAQEKVRVVNLSLGSPDEPGLDMVEQAVQGLSTFTGTLFVIASGNNGRAGLKVSSPASADAALAVGSVSKQDVYSTFSNPGPRLGDGVLKPEIVAPGQDITAARSKDSQLTGSHVAMSGTSMATPHVAGAAAILLQQHPTWKAPQLKAALMGSAQPIANATVYQQGAGRLDVGRAVRQTVTASPGGVTLGQHRAPHDDDTPVTKPVSYQNAGAEPVTLALSLAAHDAAGKPAPAGMFRLSTDSLTVPAGGQATIQVTGDTRVGGPVDVYGGTLTATSAGEVAVRTPVGLELQPEEYVLTVNHVNRQGQATNRARLVVAGLDNDYLRAIPELRTGTVELLLPKGRYLVASTIMDLTPQRTVTSLVRPVVDVTKAATVEMDARLGKPIAVTVPRADAIPISAYFNFTATVGAGNVLGLSIGGQSFAEVFSARLGPDGVSTKNLDTKLTGYWGQRQADGTTHNSPWTIAAAQHEEGTFPTGYQRAIRASELTAIETSFAEEAPGGQVLKVSWPRWPGVPEDDYASGTTMNTPGRRTDYVTTADQVRWSSEVNHSLLGVMPDAPHIPGYVNYFATPAKRYEPGRTYRESWNKGVFGPAFPAPRPGQEGISRLGDRLIVGPTLFSDAEGRLGSAVTATANVTLQRDGVTIIDRPGTGGWMDVPADAATYRLTVDTTRKAPVQLSTLNRVSWTFRSGHIDGEAKQPLPLPVIRFLPRLDDHNKAPAGPLLLLPFEVRGQPGAPAVATAKLDLRVSFDGGVTWQRPALVRFGNAGLATIARPAGSGFVSLKGSAITTAGAAVEQTILHAFRY